MEQLKKTVHTFIYIVAGSTISAAIFITLFTTNVLLSSQLLWQIIGISAVCACGDLIFIAKSELGKKQMKVRMVIHYLYINIVVFAGAFLFEWLKPGFILKNSVMFLLIIAVYIGVTMGTLRQEEKTAEKLTMRLRKIHPGEQEKEELK